MLCPHASVVAIVQSDDGEYLVMCRRTPPEGVAFVSGHADDEENPEHAVVRELFEETGLRAGEVNLMVRRMRSVPCSRGFDEHEEYVFEILTWSGKPENREPDKCAWLRFCDPDFIPHLLGGQP